MPKRKRYADLSRFQQWRRRQEICYTVRNINIKEMENSQENNPQENNHQENIPQENNPQENYILENNIDYSNNNDACVSDGDIAEFRTDCNSKEESDMESDLYEETDIESVYEEYNAECYQDLNFNPQKENPLRDFLRTWSLENNITHVALTKLLKGLIENGHKDVPNDARTLLQTPNKTFTTKSDSGTFYYHGLQRSLKDHLKRTKHLSKPIENPIKINLSIDGLPLAKVQKHSFGLF